MPQTRSRTTTSSSHDTVINTPMNLGDLLPPLLTPPPPPSFRDFIAFERQILSDTRHPNYPTLIGDLARLLTAHDEKPVDKFYINLVSSVIHRDPPGVAVPSIQATSEDFARMKAREEQSWRSSNFHRALEERADAMATSSTLSNSAGVRRADMLLHAFTLSLDQFDGYSPTTGEDLVDNAETPFGSAPLAPIPSFDDVSLGQIHQRVHSAPARLSVPQRSKPPVVRRTSPQSRRVEWRVASMVADFKFGPSYFKLFCQVAAYAEQLYYAHGTFLAGVFRQARFARVLVLNSTVLALEVSSEAAQHLLGLSDLITPGEKNALDPETRQFLEVLDDIGIPYGRLKRLEQVFHNTRTTRVSPPHTIGHLDAQGAARPDSASMTALMDFIELGVDLLLPMDPFAPLPVIPRVSLDSIGSMIRRYFSHSTGVVNTGDDFGHLVDVLKPKASAKSGSTKQSNAGTRTARPEKLGQGTSAVGDDVREEGEERDKDEDEDEDEEFGDVDVTDSASNPDERVGTWADLIADFVVVLLKKDTFEAVASSMTAIALSSTVSSPWDSSEEASSKD